MYIHTTAAAATAMSERLPPRINISRKAAIRIELAAVMLCHSSCLTNPPLNAVSKKNEYKAPRNNLEVIGPGAFQIKNSKISADAKMYKMYSQKSPGNAIASV